MLRKANVPKGFPPWYFKTTIAERVQCWNLYNRDPGNLTSDILDEQVDWRTEFIREFKALASLDEFRQWLKQKAVEVALDHSTPRKVI